MDLRAADVGAARLLRAVEVSRSDARAPAARTSPSRSASSRAVPLGTSGLVALA